MFLRDVRSFLVDWFCVTAILDSNAEEVERTAVSNWCAAMIRQRMITLMRYIIEKFDVFEDKMQDPTAKEKQKEKRQKKRFEALLLDMEEVDAKEHENDQPHTEALLNLVERSLGSAWLIQSDEEDEEFHSVWMPDFCQDEIPDLINTRLDYERWHFAFFNACREAQEPVMTISIVHQQMKQVTSTKFQSQRSMNLDKMTTSSWLHDNVCWVRTKQDFLSFLLVDFGGTDDAVRAISETGVLSTSDSREAWETGH